MKKIIILLISVILFSVGCNDYNGTTWAPVKNDKHIKDIWEEIANHYPAVANMFENNYETFSNYAIGSPREFYSYLKKCDVAYTKRSRYYDLTRRTGLQKNPMFEFLSKDQLKESFWDENGIKANIYYRYIINNKVIEIYSIDGNKKDIILIGEKQGSRLIFSNTTGGTYCILEKD